MEIGIPQQTGGPFPDRIRGMVIPQHGSRFLRKGRSSHTGGIYFVTTSTFGRLPLLADFHRACAMSRQLHGLSRICSCQNLCWVVIPDHVHFLVQLGEISLSRVVQRLKSRSAVMLNHEFQTTGRLWSGGYYDHALRREENLREVSAYIIWNPVRAGLVERPADYPFWDAAWL